MRYIKQDKTRLEQSIFRYFYINLATNVINLLLNVVFVRRQRGWMVKFLLTLHFVTDFPFVTHFQL